MILNNHLDTISEIVSNLTAFVLKEHDAPMSADSHLAQAIFTILLSLEQEELDSIASARGQVYYAFKECTAYDIFPKNKPSLSESFNVNKNWTKALNYKPSPEECFIYDSECGEKVYGIAYFKHPGDSPRQLFTEQITEQGERINKKERRESEVVFRYNFNVPSRPLYYAFFAAQNNV